MIADLSLFWRWGPHDGWSLTGTELRWWYGQMVRIIEARAIARAQAERE